MPYLAAAPRNPRRRYMGAVLPAAAPGVTGLRICPAWGCGGPYPPISFPRNVSPTPTQPPSTSTTPSSGAPGTINRWKYRSGQPVNVSGQPSTITNYDPYGNPIYSVPPAGQTIVAYDQAGNPIYSSSGAGFVPGSNYTPDQLAAIAAAQGGAAAAPAAAAPAVTVSSSTDTYSSIVDWFNSSSLISGVQNFWIVGGGALLWLLISRKKQR